jgi:hypothetical protein
MNFMVAIRLRVLVYVILSHLKTSSTLSNHQSPRRDADMQSLRPTD